MQQSSSTRNSLSRHQLGFTLIELMVVVAMVAILAMLAGPSWTQMRIRAALRGGVNDFTASLEYARNQAGFLVTPVTVCPSSDGVNCTDTPYNLGWIVRTGLQANGANQIVLQDNQPSQTFRLDATNAANRRFTFLPNGDPASNFNGAVIEVCPVDNNYLALTRSIAIDRTGKRTLSNPGGCTI